MKKRQRYTIIYDGQYSEIRLCEAEIDWCHNDSHEKHYPTFQKAKEELLRFAQEYVHSWRRTCGDIRRMKKNDVGGK